MNTEIQINMHTQNITKPRWTEAPPPLSSSSPRQKKNGLKSVKTPNGDIINSFSTVLNKKTNLINGTCRFLPAGATTCPNDLG